MSLEECMRIRKYLEKGWNRTYSQWMSSIHPCGASQMTWFRLQWLQPWQSHIAYICTMDVAKPVVLQMCNVLMRKIHIDRWPINWLACLHAAGCSPIQWRDVSLERLCNVLCTPCLSGHPGVLRRPHGLKDRKKIQVVFGLLHLALLACFASRPSKKV